MSGMLQQKLCLYEELNLSIIMIMKYSFFILYLVFIFNSCDQTQQDYNVFTIETDITSNAELTLSKYFDNFRMIKLSNDSIMGEIEIIRFENNRIYISDGKSIFIFSDSGELLSCFNKRGGGPGEYAGITDFVVDGENITILSRSIKRLLTYTNSGECISTQTIDYWAQSISPTVENVYFLYCGNEFDDKQKHKLRRINNEKEDSQYLPVDKKYLNFNWKSNFFKYQKSIFFFELFNDIVYEYVNG